jgi:hypothetical protein
MPGSPVGYWEQVAIRRLPQCVMEAYVLEQLNGIEYYLQFTYGLIPILRAVKYTQPEWTSLQIILKFIINIIVHLLFGVPVFSQ